jgi:protein-S-isoprenylcysteine O-methyltransferase Ste14
VLIKSIHVKEQQNMKSIFKIVLLVLGTLQVLLPVMNVITNGIDNIFNVSKVLIVCFLNSIIYFAVVFLLNENDKKDEKLKEFEKRFEYHYESIQSIENNSKE